MTGSKMRFSRSGHPGIPDGAAPRTQESHPSTLGGLGAHIEWFNSHVPLDATPLGGHRLTSGPSTAATRAPSVSGVIGWHYVARRASNTLKIIYGVTYLKGWF